MIEHGLASRNLEKNRRDSTNAENVINQNTREQNQKKLSAHHSVFTSNIRQFVLHTYNVTQNQLLPFLFQIRTRPLNILAVILSSQSMSLFNLFVCMF